MYKCNFQDIPNVIKSMFMFNQDVHSYNTRNSNLIHVPVARTELLYKTFKFRGIHIWNDVLVNIDVNVSFVLFKKLFYNHVSNNVVSIRYQH